MAGTAIITMVYNEPVYLPIWLRHYSAHCPGAALFVVDHGSNDGSTGNIGAANLIPLPRTPFDDGDRAEAMSDLQLSLLRFYDVVVYTDCDEMLVADPRRHASLAAFLDTARDDVIAPTGLNVQHIPDIDPALDLSAPILGQRRHVRFGVAFCKPVVVRKPVRWAPGFHFCDQRPIYRQDLFMFHLHKMEISLAVARLEKMREMAWSERARAMGWGSNQRDTQSALRRRGLEAQAREFMTAGAEPFEFSGEIDRLVRSLYARDGVWYGEHRAGRFSVVPKEFWHLA